MPRQETSSQHSFDKILKKVEEMAIEQGQKSRNWKRVEIDQLTKNNAKQFKIIVEKSAAEEGEQMASYDADSINMSEDLAKKWIDDDSSKLGL
jgi:hypothetical protein